jgi:ribonucleoside-triphosphate reductase
VKKIATNYEIPYFTYRLFSQYARTTAISKENTLPARHAVRRLRMYSRIVGYYRPVQNWNIGKKGEF